MEKTNETLTQMIQALPESFDFYHLGKVETKSAEASDFLSLSDSVFIGFRFQGDLNGILITIFDKGLDHSVYTELGNILASQFATRLGNEQEIDVMISPPQVLSDQLFDKLTADAPSALNRTYHHLHGGMTVPVQVMLLPAVIREAGRA